MVAEQVRGKSIAMTEQERDAFLREERVCRLGSVNGDGGPHVSPVWFAWEGESLWFNSIVKSARWANLQRDPRVSAVIDAGHGYEELRGVEFIGVLEIVGEVPRVGDPHPDLDAIEIGFAQKYFSHDAAIIDGKHGWMRLVPSKIVSWDFRKRALAAAARNATAEASV
jgi:hypothetical protein